MFRRVFLCCFLGLLFGFPLCGPAGRARAQEVAAEWGQLARTFEAGVAAFREGRFDEARQHLSAAFNQDYGFQHPVHGAVAYWLGLTFEAGGERDVAFQVWTQGMLALRRRNAFDVRLAERFSRATLAWREDPSETLYATQIYYDLLARAGTADEPPEVRRMVAQMAFLLPDSLRRQATGAAIVSEAGAERIAPVPGAGAALIAWWRAQDPLPATAHNERLAEHMQRVSRALDRYGCETLPSGFDDRGMLYVRLDEPGDRGRVTYPRLNQAISMGSIILLPRDLPENEVWLYTGLQALPHYIFVVRDGCYRLSETYDLLPAPLQRGYGMHGRTAQAKAGLLMKAFFDIYEVIGYMDADYSARHLDVREQLYAESQTRPPEAIFVEDVIYKAYRMDDYIAEERAKNTPLGVTAVFDAFEPLLLALHTARFLDEDGTTRTEVYWTPFPGALRPTSAQVREFTRAGYRSTDRFLIRVTAAQKNFDYVTRNVAQTWHRVDAAPLGPGAVLVPRTLVVRGDRGRYHLAFQWDQYLLGQDDEAEGSRQRPLVRRGTFRMDSVKALNASESVLEMSDLKPMLAPEDLSKPVETWWPYPFKEVSANRPVALYFEVYHLTYGADDRTHFRVSYEVTREKKGTGLFSFLKGTEEQRVTGTFTYTGNSRTAREHILLDLSDLTEEGTLVVVVRITDETSGQQVERTLNFEMTAAGR